MLLIAFVAVPAVASPYVIEAMLLPFLALALAGVGLNLLTGYGGQVSLGSAASMAVGAFAAYNFQLRLNLPLPITILLSALTAAAVGLIFGLPSLRLRGYYLAVSTLAAQFFLQWALTKFGWFSNYSPSGVISAPALSWLGHSLHGTTARYLLALSLVSLITLGVWAFTVGPLGNDLIAIRRPGPQNQTRRLRAIVGHHRRGGVSVGLHIICARWSLRASISTDPSMCCSSSSSSAAWPPCAVLSQARG